MHTLFVYCIITNKKSVFSLNYKKEVFWLILNTSCCLLAEDGKLYLSI
jgi:hypothetical protein